MESGIEKKASEPSSWREFFAAVFWLVGIAMIYGEVKSWPLVAGISLVVGANNIMIGQKDRRAKQ